jgi:NAD(P)-dependent dehydrogenase (short-subunit alcohol dehydrogenase family)
VKLAVDRLWEVKPLTVRLDCISYDESERIARQLRSDLKSWKPNALIHAAGVNLLSWIGDTDPMDFWDTFSVNVFSFYEVVNQAKSLGLGPMRVVVIGSDAGRVPMRCSSLYCASKAALSHMVKVMARELAPGGWRINCVAPGLVEDTAMTKKVYNQVTALRGWSESQLTETMLGMIPDGRAATATEVAELAMFLLSDAAGHINGETINLTGGK